MNASYTAELLAIVAKPNMPFVICRVKISSVISSNHMLLYNILGFNHELPPGLFPTFFLHMERGDGKKIFLLTSRRRIKSSTCSVSKELLNRN